MRDDGLPQSGQRWSAGMAEKDADREGVHTAVDQSRDRSFLDFSRSEALLRQDATMNSRAHMVLALLVACLLGIRSPVASWLSWGVILCLAALPVTFVGIRRNTAWRVLVGACALAAIWGGLLADWSLSQDPARYIDSSRQLFDIGNLLGLLLMTMAGLWCVRVLGPSKFLAAWAIGMIPVAVWGNAVFFNNPWKFGLALPVSILIILSLGNKFRGARICAVVIIGLICLWFGYRSWLVIVLIAFVSTMTANRSSISRHGRMRTFFKGGLILGSASLVSELILALVLNGALGQAVQERTRLQLAWGDGNLFLGGRAEWGAALGLFNQNPFGFGLGVTPSNSDWLIAIRSLYMPEGLQEVSNVSGYFRTGAIEFHSVLWNFWSHYGWAGLFLWAVIAFFIGYGFFAPQRFKLRENDLLPQAVVLLAIAWDLLFSPTVLPNIAAALAIGISLITTVRIGTAGKERRPAAEAVYVHERKA